MSPGAAHDRTPCLIGTARRTWHAGGTDAPEPLDMWAEVARAAAEDALAGRSAGATVRRPDPLALVDDLGVVHCLSWSYDDPATRLADELGLRPGHRTVSILAGTSPQRLLNAAAERMLRGGTRAALVVGGEAAATRRRLAAAGEPTRWRYAHPDPPALPVDLDEWYLPTEVAHGVLPAWLTFALLEQARWARRGGLAADHDELVRLLGRLNRVAAANPDAWHRDRLTEAQIGRPTPDNRMVATPYTKRMTAFPDVDMAAGHLLVTNGLADELGIDPARRVHLRGWGFARDATSVGARADLASSPAMAAATTDALDGAGIGIDDVDCFDLYSCFGSAVQFALDALGLDAADPRPLTLTGGLPYHGGPGSNYLSHSISHLVDRLRRGDATIGMVTGVGMHLTKHVAAVWSSAPGPTPPTPPDTDATLARVRAAHPDTPVLDRHDGPAGVVAACVVHGRDGHPDHAVAICEAPGGGRCYARSEDPDVLAAVAADAWLDRKAVLGPGPRSTNAFTF